MIIAQGPLIPEEFGGAVYLIVGLGVVLMYLTLFGLKTGYQYSLGSLLDRLARLTGHIWAVGGTLSHAIDAVNQWVEQRLAEGLQATELAMAKWWQGLEWLVRTTGDVLAEFGADVEHGFRALVHGTIPAAISTGTKGITDAIGSLRQAVGAIERNAEHRLAAAARALEAEIARDFGAAWRGIDHLRGSVAGEIAHLGSVLSGDIAALRSWAWREFGVRLRILTELLAAGAIEAIAVSAVSRLWPWLRCSNVQRAGRAVCRMPTHLLDDLLGLVTDFFILENICSILPLLEEGFSHVAAPLVEALTVAGAGACRGIEKDAPPLTTPTLHLPAAASLTLYLP